MFMSLWYHTSVRSSRSEQEPEQPMLGRFKLIMLFLYYLAIRSGRDAVNQIVTKDEYRTLEGMIPLETRTC